MAEVETSSDMCSSCGKTSPMLKLLQCNHRCCLACLDNTTGQKLHLDDNDLQQCLACQQQHQRPSSDRVERLVSVTVKDDWVQIDRMDAADVIVSKSDGTLENPGRADKVDGIISSTVDKVVHGDVTDAKPSNSSDESASDKQGPTNSQGVETKDDKNNNEAAIDHKSHKNDELKKATEQSSTIDKERSNGVEILGQGHSEIHVTSVEDKTNSPKTDNEVDGSATVSEMKDLCKEHPSEVLTIYCKACDQPMCVQCFLQDHKTHDVEDIKFAREHVRNKLSDFISRMSEVLSLPATVQVDSSERLVAARRRVDETATKLHQTVDRDAQILRDTLAAQEAEIDRKKSVVDGHKLELKKVRSTCQEKADAGQELVDWNEIKELNKQAEQVEEKLRSIMDDKSVGGDRENLERVDFVAFDVEKFMPSNEKNLVGKICFGLQDQPLQQRSYSELQHQLQQESHHKTELQSNIELLERRGVVPAAETGQENVELHKKLQQLNSDLELERELHRKEMTKLREEHSEQLKHSTKASESSMTNEQAQTQQELALQTSRHLVELSEAQAKIVKLQQTVEEKDKELSGLKRSQQEQTSKQFDHSQSSQVSTSAASTSRDEDLSLAGLADYNAKVLKDEEPSSPVKRRSSSGLTKSTRTSSTDVDSDAIKVQTTPEPKLNALNRRQSDRKKSSSDVKSSTTASGAETESSDANVRPSDIVKSQLKSSTSTSDADVDSQSIDANVRPSDVVKSQMKSWPPSTSTFTSGAEAESNLNDANVRPSDIVKSQMKSTTTITTTGAEAESNLSDANVRPSDIVKSQMKSTTTTTTTASNKPTLHPLKSPSRDDSELSAGLTSPLTPDSRRNINATNAAKQLSPGVLGQYSSVIDCNAVWKAYQEVLDDKSPTQWLKLGHEDKKIVVLSTGSTYQQFRDTLTDDQGLYGFVRLTSGDEHAKLPKFVLIMWVGANVPAPQAAMMTLGKAHVTAIIENRMLEVRASSLQEIEEQVLLEALRKVGGSI